MVYHSFENLHSYGTVPYGTRTVRSIFACTESLESSCTGKYGSVPVPYSQSFSVIRYDGTGKEIK